MPVLLAWSHSCMPMNTWRKLCAHVVPLPSYLPMLLEEALLRSWQRQQGEMCFSSWLPSLTTWLRHGWHLAWFQDSPCFALGTEQILMLQRQSIKFFAAALERTDLDCGIFLVSSTDNSLISIMYFCLNEHSSICIYSVSGALRQGEQSAFISLRTLRLGLRLGRPRRVSAVNNDRAIRSFTTDLLNGTISINSFLHRASLRVLNIFDQIMVWTWSILPTCLS